jgi:hypothetical protein
LQAVEFNQKSYARSSTCKTYLKSTQEKSQLHHFNCGRD